MKESKKQTLGEEIANCVSHGLMTAFGIVALVLLILKSNTTMELTAAIIYGSSMIILYLMSTLYHALINTPKKVFRRFDYVSIYLLITGTMAPIVLLVVVPENPVLGWTMFAIQWALSILGIVLKAAWFHRFKYIHFVLCFLIGWVAIIFIGYVKDFNNTAFWLVLIGGIAYTGGIVFFALSKVKYFHFIWHLFVAAGTILHFIAIFGLIF